MSDTDWNGERFVTALQFLEMPAWQREWFADQPNIWRSHPDFNVDVLINMAHPENKELAARVLIDDVSHV